jgi:hypothetical protein
MRSKRIYLDDEVEAMKNFYENSRKEDLIKKNKLGEYLKSTELLNRYIKFVNNTFLPYKIMGKNWFTNILFNLSKNKLYKIVQDERRKRPRHY